MKKVFLRKRFKLEAIKKYPCFQNYFFLQVFDIKTDIFFFLLKNTFLVL